MVKKCIKILTLGGGGDTQIDRKGSALKMDSRPGVNTGLGNGELGLKNE